MGIKGSGGAVAVRSSWYFNAGDLAHLAWYFDTSDLPHNNRYFNAGDSPRLAWYFITSDFPRSTNISSPQKR